MKKIITLSGWGQAADALAGIAPGSTAIDYAAYGSLDAFMGGVAGSCDVLIGWSLGGQLAVQAVPVLRPKLLVLISTAFTFDNTQFDAFSLGFAAHPEQSLQRFRLLMAHGDSYAKHIIHKATYYTDTTHLAYWLGLLKTLDAAKVSFTDFPRTLIIHGDQDSIVSPDHAARFAEVIPNNKHVIIQHCGHAPHMHDAQKIATIIDYEISNTA